MEVTWDELSDATEYIISYSTTASNINDGNVIVKGGSTTCHTVTNLEGNTPYIITVQATASDSRKSALSNEVVVVTHTAGKSYTYIHNKINIIRWNYFPYASNQPVTGLPQTDLLQGNHR